MKYPKTKEVLNNFVADLSQGVTKIHQVHWYMRGVGFMKFHPLMDEYMDELNGYLDEIAERLIALDGDPYSTLEEFVEHSCISSEVGDWNKTMQDQLEVVIKVFRYLADKFKEGIEISGEEGEDVSQDIFIGALGSLQKHIWMLEAHLDRAPHQDV
ncbi:DNA starvation/stationary phase protection protein [Enterococcus hirae]|jgi:starvation-inducible DNA-binding protein|nr:DNA starvation/stationary phase protection protein [Enterococcaceae bacterium]MDM8214227.1 DNA starvation/stationary phase protection protein [Enterococcus hirae]